MVKIIILGAGISGLSLGWYLKKKWGGDLDLTIVEKSNQAGGLIKTIQSQDFLFDLGPRSCRTSANGAFFLDLLEDLGLQDEVILPSPDAKNRYIYKNKKMEKLPSGFVSFLSSPLTCHSLKYVVRDFFGFSKSVDEDESAYAFMMRKYGSEITDNLFAALISGIYAGDIKKLSLKACFPLLHQAEKEYGSLIRGMLFKKNKKIESPLFYHLGKPSIISFKKGMQTLTDALSNQLKEHILFEKQAARIEILKESAKVHMEDGSILEADVLVSSLAANHLEPLVESPKIKSLLSCFYSAPIASVCLGFKKPVLKQKGFGYLIPPKEKEKILGVVFDSSIFKQQNKEVDETRLTVMIGGAHFENFDSYSAPCFLRLASEAISSHLGVKEKPATFHVEIAKNAIAQYFTGHEAKLHDLLKALPSHFKIIGSSFSGVSVNDCIMNSYLAANVLAIAKKS
ncbi:MAG TPA: protoporphyrinogen oxidase [Parachlamydiaceae bacterium]|nr:protoporphyrinogen oxidase [Parachlamydiaceae bacterium]